MKNRCRWCNLKNERYVRYHDEEWGAAKHEDAALFELLILEPFQAGLSWETVLNKRENFRRAYGGFDAEKISAYGEEKIQALMADAGLIRNRKKIEASIQNAAVFLAIQREWGSFADYIWHFTGGRVIAQHGLTRSELSDEITRDFKKRGMNFFGTTTVYAFLQAAGIVNSHDEACFLFPGKPDRCSEK